MLIPKHISQWLLATALIIGGQEEMGMGIRVTTPIMVKQQGHITNSDATKTNEAPGVNRPTGVITLASSAISESAQR